MGLHFFFSFFFFSFIFCKDDCSVLFYLLTMVVCRVCLLLIYGCLLGLLILFIYFFFYNFITMIVGLGFYEIWTIVRFALL